MFSMVVNSVQSTKKYLHLLYEIKYRAGTPDWIILISMLLKLNGHKILKTRIFPLQSCAGDLRPSKGRPRVDHRPPHPGQWTPRGDKLKPVFLCWNKLRMADSDGCWRLPGLVEDHLLIKTTDAWFNLLRKLRYYTGDWRLEPEWSQTVARKNVNLPETGLRRLVEKCRIW